MPAEKLASKYPVFFLVRNVLILVLKALESTQVFPRMIASIPKKTSK
jgi:hypothetical protein